MGIATTTTSYGGGDYRWLASARGTEAPKSGTLDVSTFTENDHYPDGYFPSGTLVQLNTSSGLYEPADETSTADTLAGAVWHDVATNGTDDVTFALLDDITVVAANVPGTHDLTDGRYICSATTVAAAS